MCSKMALVQVCKIFLCTATSALALMRRFKATGYLSQVIKYVLTAMRLHFYSLRRLGAQGGSVVAAARSQIRVLLGMSGTREDKACFLNVKFYKHLIQKGNRLNAP